MLSPPAPFLGSNPISQVSIVLILSTFTPKLPISYLQPSHPLPLTVSHPLLYIPPLPPSQPHPSSSNTLASPTFTTQPPYPPLSPAIPSSITPSLSPSTTHRLPNLHHFQPPQSSPLRLHSHSFLTLHPNLPTLHLPHSFPTLRQPQIPALHSLCFPTLHPPDSLPAFLELLHRGSTFMHPHATIKTYLPYILFYQGSPF